MKNSANDLKKPLSKQVRRARRAKTPAERARADLAAQVEAYLEAGHLSPSDLEGEISMLRSVIRRVFELTSEVSKGLEAREVALLEENAGAAEKGRGKQASEAHRSRKPESEHSLVWQQARLLPDESTPDTAVESGKGNLELWVQTLESLSRGAMRLANLMRTHQVLKQREGEEGEREADGMAKIGESVSEINTSLRKKQMDEE